MKWWYSCRLFQVKINKKSPITLDNSKECFHFGSKQPILCNRQSLSGKCAVTNSFEMAHPHPAFLPVAPPVFASAEEERRFTEIRSITGYVRPAGTHGAKLTQIVPGVWTAHFNDIKEVDIFTKLAEITPAMGLVVNSAVANNQCPTCAGHYGPDIEVLCIDLLDDPKEGEAHQFAGDAYMHFKTVNSSIKKTLDSGKSALVHCMASLSRSVVLIIAYLMESRSISALEATKMVKAVWDPTFPNDRFVFDLLKFETELGKV